MGVPENIPNGFTEKAPLMTKVKLSRPNPVQWQLAALGALQRPLVGFDEPGIVTDGGRMLGDPLSNDVDSLFGIDREMGWLAGVRKHRKAGDAIHRPITTHFDLQGARKDQPLFRRFHGRERRLRQIHEVLMCQPFFSRQ